MTGIFENADCRWTLSFAEPGDVAALKAAEDACFPSDPWSERMIADALANPGCKIYTAKDMQTSNIIAYGVMYYCLDEADLANIATLPEVRGKGIGGALLDAILEDARKQGVVRTFLEVRESNAPARGLYDSRGFAEIGERRNYYRSPTENAVVMVREETV